MVELCKKVGSCRTKISRLLFPWAGTNKNSSQYRHIDKIWLQKNLVAWICKIVLSISLAANEGQSWDLSYKFIEKHTEDLNVDFLNATLPTLHKLVFALKVLRIPLALFYIKAPAISRYYFLWETVVTLPEVWIIYADFS